MTTLSVTDASRKAGVSRQTIYEQIRHGEIKRTSAGIDLTELIRVYPKLAQATSEQMREVISSMATKNKRMQNGMPAISKMARQKLKQAEQHRSTVEKTIQQAGTVELLVRELEWNKELLEKTNQLMAKQLAEQRSLIADQARRLDEKDRFWARQVEIAQSLLPAPAPTVATRKKFLGIF